MLWSQEEDRQLISYSGGFCTLRRVTKLDWDHQLFCTLRRVTKLDWDHQLVFCSEVVDKEGLLHVKYFYNFMMVKRRKLWGHFIEVFCMWPHIIVILLRSSTLSDSDVVHEEGWWSMYKQRWLESLLSKCAWLDSTTHPFRCHELSLAYRYISQHRGNCVSLSLKILIM